MYISVNSVRTMSLLATLLPPSFETKLYTKTINFTDLKKTRVAFPVKKSKKNGNFIQHYQTPLVLTKAVEGLGTIK